MDRMGSTIGKSNMATTDNNYPHGNIISRSPVNYTIHVELKVKVHSVCFNSAKVIEVK